MKQEYLSVKQLAGEIGTNKLTIHRAINKLGLQGKLHKAGNRYMLSESQAKQIKSIILGENVSSPSKNVSIVSNKIVSGTPKIVSNVSKIVSSTPEIVSNVSEIVSDTPKNVSIVSNKIVSDTPEIVSNVSEIVSSTPEIVSNVSKIVSSIPENVSNVSEIVSDTPKNVSNVSKIVSDTPENVSNVSNKIVSNKIVSETHETQSMNIENTDKTYQPNQDLQLSILDRQLTVKDNQIQMLQEQIKLLQQQLIAKDNQIGQITAAMENLTTALSAEQALHAGTIQKQLADHSVKEEPETEQPKQKQSIFSRFFGKKANNDGQ